MQRHLFKRDLKKQLNFEDILKQTLGVWRLLHKIVYMMYPKTVNRAFHVCTSSSLEEP